MRFFTLLDLKSIGAVKWVTAALDLSVTAAVFLLFPGKREAWIILELLFPYTTVLCGIFVLGNLWQRSSLTEMLAACNKGFHRILMVKYLIFIFFFAIAHMLEAALLCLQDGRSDGIWFVILLFGECLCFGGIAFFLTVFMRDAGWTAMIMPCIIAGDYGSGGRLFGSFHVALYWYENLSFSAVETRLIRTGALTVFFFVTGYAGIRKAYKNQKSKKKSDRIGMSGKKKSRKEKEPERERAGKRKSRKEKEPERERAGKRKSRKEKEPERERADRGKSRQRKTANSKQE